MLSAILGVLNTAGKRIDAALVAASGIYRPTWLKFSAPFTASAAANGQQETITTISMPAATASNDGYMTAAQAASVAAGPSAGDVQSALSSANSVTLAGGWSAYNPDTVPTTDATPTNIVVFPLATGHCAMVKLWVTAKSSGNVFKTSGELFVANPAGSLVTKQSNTVGIDVDEITIGGISYGIISGNFVAQVTGVSATNITWAASALVLVL
jgi:hypothetical protein